MHLPFLTSAWLFTQLNSLTSAESIPGRVHHGPTLLPSLGVTQLSNFSGNVLASNLSPSGEILPLSISHYVFIPPNDFKQFGISWCGAAFPALVGEGAVELQSLIQPSSKAPVAAADPGARCQARTSSTLVPVQVPGTLLPQRNLITICFSTSSTVLASKLHISWDSIGSSLCSSEDWLGIPVGCTRK